MKTSQIADYLETLSMQLEWRDKDLVTKSHTLPFALKAEFKIEPPCTVTCLRLLDYEKLCMAEWKLEEMDVPADFGPNFTMNMENACIATLVGKDVRPKEAFAERAIRLAKPLRTIWL